MKHIYFILTFFIFISCSNEEKKADEASVDYLNKIYSKNSKLENCAEPVVVFKKGSLEKSNYLNSISEIQLDYLKTTNPADLPKEEYKKLLISNEEFNNFYEAVEEVDAEKGYYLVHKCINNKGVDLVVDTNFKVLNNPTDLKKIDKIINKIK